jgi:hypothetical protein
VRDGGVDVFAEQDDGRAVAPDGRSGPHLGSGQLDPFIRELVDQCLAEVVGRVEREDDLVAVSLASGHGPQPDPGRLGFRGPRSRNWEVPGVLTSFRHERALPGSSCAGRW